MIRPTLGGLVAGLSFLTRLGPARIYPKEAFPGALPWFPVIGLLLGALCAMPPYWGLLRSSPGLQGWFVAGLSLWFTRGLHADGLADIADAWGSGATGDRFWEILKDSRVGPFGVLGLVMALGGQILAYGELAAQGRLGAICWCLALGRFTSLAALALSKSRVRPGLCSLFAPGATTGTLGFAAVTLYLGGAFLTTLPAMLAGTLLAAAVAVFGARLSTRQQGFNGDFMGAAIVMGELAGAVGALL